MFILQKVVANKTIMALIAAATTIFLCFTWLLWPMVKLFLWVAAVFYMRLSLMAYRRRNLEDAALHFGSAIVLVSAALLMHIALWKFSMLFITAVAVIALLRKRRRLAEASGASMN